MIRILREARQLLARPGNDFAWSPWEDADAALGEMDGLISKLQAGNLPPRLDFAVLFAPTGPLQEVSVASGWGKEFLELAAKWDQVAERVYGRA